MFIILFNLKLLNYYTPSIKDTCWRFREDIGSIHNTVIRGYFSD